MTDRDTRDYLLEWLDENGDEGTLVMHDETDEKEVCKSLFCHYEAEITVYSHDYGEEIGVCPVCVAEKLGVRDVPEGRKRLGEMANEHLDDEPQPLPWEIISDTTAADMGIEGR